MSKVKYFLVALLLISNSILGEPLKFTSLLPGEYPWVAIIDIPINKNKINFPCSYPNNSVEIPRLPGQGICEYKSQFNKNISVRIYNNHIGFIIYSWTRLCLPFRVGGDITRYPFREIIKLYNITNTTHFFVRFPQSNAIFAYVPELDKFHSKFPRLYLGSYPTTNFGNWGIIGYVIENEFEFKKLFSKPFYKNYEIIKSMKPKFYLLFYEDKKATKVYPLWANYGSVIDRRSSWRKITDHFVIVSSPLLCSSKDVPLNITTWKFVVKNELMFLKNKSVINLTKKEIDTITGLVRMKRGRYIISCNGRRYSYLHPTCLTIRVNKTQTQIPSFIGQLKEFFNSLGKKSHSIKMSIVMLGILIPFYLIFYLIIKKKLK